MKTINIHQAKTHLSKLLEMVSDGKTIIIANAGKPVAILGPIKPASMNRKLGLLKNKIKISADFDAPLDNDILDDFEEK
jgi:prevent-host-death family protein